MTPDDPVVQAGQTKFKPRDNVLIEFGLFAGSLGRERTFALVPFHDLSLHIPTDLAGVVQAPLRPSLNPAECRYDVQDGCRRIAAAIEAKGRRSDPDIELAVLYRLINAFAFPHYENVHVPALQRVKHRTPRETFDRIDDVVDFLADLLTYYVYPRLNPGQRQSLRIYFTYYLGDGVNIANLATQTSCSDLDHEGKSFTGEFVIGLANPTEIVDEPNWRIGRVIKGYAGPFAESLCAQVFDTGNIDGYDDIRTRPQGTPNYRTADELAVYAFPVEWRSGDGNARIAVVSVSSRTANKIDAELRTTLVLLANVIGFLFSLYAVRHRDVLQKDGNEALRSGAVPRGLSLLDDSDGSRRFAAEVVGLRRHVASYFERKMLVEKRHVVVDGGLRVS